VLSAAAGAAGAPEEEEEEEEEEAEDEKRVDEDQQRTQASIGSLEGRMEGGADAVVTPRRVRLPPGSYADTVVDYDEEEEDEDEDKEKEWVGDEEDTEEEEEEEEPCDLRAHAPGASLKGRNEAVRPHCLLPGARSEPGSLRARLRESGRVADNDVKQAEEEEEAADFAPVLRTRGGPGPAAPLSSRASPGTRPAKHGGRDARGNAWAITPRRKLRRVRTANTWRTASIL
jgi:hypothetical protein